MNEWAVYDVLSKEYPREVLSALVTATERNVLFIGTSAVVLFLFVFG